ncbi:endolytic transglycosylase MltG [Leptolyngbya sp. AN02str]|uniref:endolytic transglycosylase MltG n=1 Tax=Leptolyngbya sp. AN02str TaxID=3423363 RepID=UPI003D321E01
MTAKQRLSKWFFYLLLLPLVIGVFGWQGWRWWSWASAPVAAAPAPSNTPTETEPPGAIGTDSSASDSTIQVAIPEGSTADEIGAILESAGLIRSDRAWDVWTRWQSLQQRNGSYQAGTYEISPSESLPEIANRIWSGDVVEMSFTIPEGWTLKQMGDYFEEEGFFTAEEFLAAANTVPRDRFPWLPENIPMLEGFLFPDTYQVSGEISPQAIVDQMLLQFEQVALPVYQQNQDQSPYSLLEWVTLASIVEKEAVVDEERPTIASVFAKRLEMGMPLGADPTVEYGLGVRQTVDKPLTYAQVETPTPYNTYINPGLTPTPIAAPGIASLEVSINPDDTDYLYFMARYDGTHIFSRTLAEHESAKRRVDADLSNQQGAANSQN